MLSSENLKYNSQLSAMFGINNCLTFNYCTLKKILQAYFVNTGFLSLFVILFIRLILKIVVKIVRVRM